MIYRTLKAKIQTHTHTSSLKASVQYCNKLVSSVRMSIAFIQNLEKFAGASLFAILSIFLESCPYFCSTSSHSRRTGAFEHYQKGQQPLEGHWDPYRTGWSSWSLWETSNAWWKCYLRKSLPRMDQQRRSQEICSDLYHLLSDVGLSAIAEDVRRQILE